MICYHIYIKNIDRRTLYTPQKTCQRHDMDEHQDDPIRALIKDRKNRSKIGQIRELLPSIQEAHAAGVSLERIVEELCKMDINVTYGYLRTVLYRIRKNAPKKINKAIPITTSHATDRTDKKTYEDFSRKEEKINLIYQEELTPKQRREKIANLFINEPKISPRLQRILEKKNESSSD